MKRALIAAVVATTLVGDVAAQRYYADHGSYGGDYYSSGGYYGGGYYSGGYSSRGGIVTSPNSSYPYYFSYERSTPRYRYKDRYRRRGNDSISIGPRWDPNYGWVYW